MTFEALLDIVVIPEGHFWMGCDRGQENEMPLHRVWVDSFGLGKVPVTNQAYRVFVAAAGADPPPFWSQTTFSDPDQPVVGVTWDDAVAYCQWLSAATGREFRLPSEAERERGARGYREGALYPWGDDPPWERPYAGCDAHTGGPQRVGSNEPNDFGLYDMSEGVHEWCSDFYDHDYYRYSPKKNPQGPAVGQRRVSRGGSWRHRVKFSRCAARSSLPPTFKYSDYGFRVAVTVSKANGRGGSAHSSF